MRFKRFRYLYPIIIIILPLIFFFRIIFNPSLTLFPLQDVVTIFFQEKELYKNTINTYTSIPLWNPYVFSGSPFLGNASSSMFYPLNLLFLIFPIHNAFGYLFIANSIIIGLFTYLFAKTIKLSKFSAFISGLTIMFSGPMMTKIFPGHLINLDAFIWFPLILLLYEQAIIKKRIIYAVLASFPMALSLFAGAPQIAVFSIFSSSVYYLLRIFMQIPSTKKLIYISKSIVVLLTPIVIAIFLSAIQTIPMVEFSKLSARGHGISYEFASDFSLHPKQLVSFLLPYFFGNPKNGTYWGMGNFWELNGYLGIIPLILVFIAILYKRTKHFTIFAALALFSLLFSFGKFAFVFPLFFNHFPIFNSFRVPSRFLYVYCFSITILAGLGMEALLEKLKKTNASLNRISKLFLIIGLISLSIFLALAYKGNVHFYEKYILRNIYAININHNNLYTDFLNGVKLFSIFLLTFPTLIFLKFKNKISLNIFKFLLTLIIIFDLWIFNYQIISVKKITDTYKELDFVREIKKDTEIYRIFDKMGYYLPITEKNSIENITGHHSLYVKDYQNFLFSMGKHENKPYESFFQINLIEYPIFLNLLNVKYILSNKEITLNNLENVSRYSSVQLNYFPRVEKELYLYRNLDVLPRAYIVPNAIVLPENLILKTLKSKNFDPKQFVILQKNPKISLKNKPSYKEVIIINRNPNMVNFEIEMNEPGFLVLSEIYYPGWKAYDNNKKTEIYKSDFILRSISLSKGKHKVTFIYSPFSYKIGIVASLSTLFLLLLYLLRNRDKLGGR